MAILNDNDVMISFECSDLLNDIREDASLYRHSKIVYAACKVQQGVKIIFDYVYDINDLDEMKNTISLNDDEWYEKTTLRSLLSYLVRLNNPTNTYSNINELLEASGMTLKAFSEYFCIPYRTMQDWVSGRNGMPQYLFELMNYKLINEHLI